MLAQLRVFILAIALIASPAPWSVSFVGAAQAESSASQDLVIRQSWELSCGAAALATVLTFHFGDPVGEQEVIEGLLQYTTRARVEERKGFSFLDLKRYAESRGYFAEGYADLAIDDLVAFAPAIVPIKAGEDHHFVVFRSVTDGYLSVADPATGNRQIAVAEFAELWTDRVALVVTDPSD